jgi:hypothetical protein
MGRVLAGLAAALLLLVLYAAYAAGESTDRQHTIDLERRVVRLETDVSLLRE